LNCDFVALKHLSEMADEHGTSPPHNSDSDIFWFVVVPSRTIQNQNMNVNA